jgi:hypothetical protein
MTTGRGRDRRGEQSLHPPTTLQVQAEYGVEFGLVFVLRLSLRSSGRITRIPSEL